MQNPAGSLPMHWRLYWDGCIGALTTGLSMRARAVTAIEPRMVPLMVCGRRNFPEGLLEGHQALDWGDHHPCRLPRPGAPISGGRRCRGDCAGAPLGSPGWADPAALIYLHQRILMAHCL